MRAERGQALVLLVGAAFVLMLGLGVLGAFGKALLGKGRYQRAADLAAVSGARSMRDDFERLFEPLLDTSGRPNPRHLGKRDYLARAKQAALDVADLNGADRRAVEVDFPDRRSLAPVRVRVRLLGAVAVRAVGDGPTRAVQIRAAAEAKLAPASSSDEGPWQPELAAGGGYSGPLAYRQGKPMRPDVARAFDRMARAAERDGVSLLITSAYRSDADQARLYARHPDPRWVAPPGRSLHRNATELDLGPAGAYAWLGRNASRFGFVQRYSWEP